MGTIFIFPASTSPIFCFSSSWAIFMKPSMSSPIISLEQVLMAPITLGLNRLARFPIPDIRFFLPPKTAASSCSDVTAISDGSRKWRENEYRTNVEHP